MKVLRLIWSCLTFAALAHGQVVMAPDAPAVAAAEQRLADDEIRTTYDLLADSHRRYLARQGVQLPQLTNADGTYTQVGLALVYLAQGYPDTKTVSKSALTEFIRGYYPNVNDVQEARHLAAQRGWYILSGTRNDARTLDIPAGAYKLVSLKKPYPGFTGQRRVNPVGPDYWNRLKAAYGHRCACCGSKEGEPHLRWPETVTGLQKGHMDPAKPLEPGNIIPQCESCNRADRDFWIYDAKGRVVGVANPAVVDRCSAEVQRKIYERLVPKFGEQDSHAIPAAEE